METQTEKALARRSRRAQSIKRFQAYREMGADVLYAPGLVTKDEIGAVVSSVARGAR